MPHQIQNFELHAGEDKTITVLVTDDGTATGTPVDISSATEITYAAYTRDEDETRVLTYQLSDDGITMPDGTDGKFYIHFVGADSEALDGWYNQEARITDGTGDKFYPFTGVLQIEPTNLDSDE